MLSGPLSILSKIRLRYEPAHLRRVVWPLACCPYWKAWGIGHSRGIIQVHHYLSLCYARRRRRNCLYLSTGLSLVSPRQQLPCQLLCQHPQCCWAGPHLTACRQRNTWGHHAAPWTALPYPTQHCQVSPCNNHGIHFSSAHEFCVSVIICFLRPAGGARVVLCCMQKSL